MNGTIYFFTVKNNTETVNLDREGRGTVQCTVANVSAAPIDGEAELAALPNTAQENDPIAKGWVKIDGSAKRHFDKDQEQAYGITIRVPMNPKDPPKPGKYSFRLCEKSDSRPDLGDNGPAITFEVPKLENGGRIKPWQIVLIILAILLVVGGGGYGVYYAIAHGGTPVPDLHGLTLQQANDLLAQQHLAIDQSHISTIESKKLEDSDKIIDQTPKPKDRAKQDTLVQVTVGAKMVPVPAMQGMTVEAAQNALQSANLISGTPNYQDNSSYAAGIVFGATPGFGEPALTGSTVTLTATPKTVPVPPLKGANFSDAWTRLRSAGLDVAGTRGDQSKTVVNSDPPEGSPIGVGKKVTLIFPITDICARNPKLCVAIHDQRLLQSLANRANQ